MTSDLLKTSEKDMHMRGQASHFSIAPRALFLVCASLILSACSFSLAEDVTPPPGYQPSPARELAPTTQPVRFPDTAPNLENGGAVYAEKCAPCHGVSGLGDGQQAGELPEGAPAIGSPQLARQAAPAEWYRVVTEGRLDKFMPPFSRSLSDQDRWDVVAYTLRLSQNGETVAEGRQLYEMNCSSCHGPGGAGDGPDAEAQAQALTDLSSPTAMAEKSDLALMAAITDGVAPGMPAFASELTEGQRWALASYVRTLSSGGPVVEQAAEADPPVEEADPGQEAPVEVAADPLEPDEAPDVYTGSIDGWVINGSGGAVPSAHEATLHAFDQIEEIYTRTVAVADDGTFEFEQVEMPESRIFMVTVEHDGLTYSSDLAIMQPDAPEPQLPVTVFETTTDASMLVIDRLHIFVESVSPGILQITELYLISNPDDRVVVAPAEREPVLTYKVPASATNLRFEPSFSEDRFVPLPNGFGDLAGIRPGIGQHQVMYAYDIAFDRSLDLEQQFELPINSVIFLMPEMGIRVRSDQLEDQGAREIQGEQFRVFSGGWMAAGTNLSVSLTGNLLDGSPAGAAEIQADTSLLVGATALIGAVGLTGLWMYRQSGRFSNRRNEPADETPPDEGKENLLDAIIALDALYTSGELPEEAYRLRRAELKARLAEKLKAE